MRGEGVVAFQILLGTRETPPDITMVAFGAIGTAVGLSTDLRSGILVRFRTLPMARIAVLAGTPSPT